MAIGFDLEPLQSYNSMMMIVFMSEGRDTFLSRTVYISGRNDGVRGRLELGT